MGVYSDLRAFDQIELKIFLREDIWKRITAKGLREASHIIRYEVMKWTPEMLRNLTMRRLLSNKVLVDEFKIDPSEVMKSSGMQDELFARSPPLKLSRDLRKRRRSNWMVTRCADRDWRDGTSRVDPPAKLHS